MVMLAADPRARLGRQPRLALEPLQVPDQRALVPSVDDAAGVDVVEVIAASVARHGVVLEVALLLVDGRVRTRPAGVGGQDGELEFVVGVDLGELDEQLLHGAVEGHWRASRGDGDGPALGLDGVVR